MIDMTCVVNPAPAAPPTCYENIPGYALPDMKRAWVLAPHFEVLYNSAGVIPDADLYSAISVFPMCSTDGTIASIDFACLTAAFATIDPYCTVCE